MAVSKSAFSPRSEFASANDVDERAKATMELSPSIKVNTDNDIKDWRLQINPVAGGNARNITGSGLGLSIVKKLAQINGGDASVTSRLGEGSAFTVTLKQHQTASDA